MDSVKQFAWPLGFRGQRKDRTRPPNNMLTVMAPVWANPSRNQSRDEVDKNLHGIRRCSTEHSSEHGARDLKMQRPQHELAASLSSSKRVPHKLEPVKSYLRLSNVDPRHSRIFPRLEKGDKYQLENLAVSKSGTYQVECSGERFRGFQNIYLDDKLTQKCQESFYDDAVKPLVGEFVHRRRNVSLILHGAEGSGRRRALFGNFICPKQDICDSSKRTSSTPINDDDLSSLGCDGVSDVRTVNCKEDTKVSVPPSEVSFRSRPSVCSRGSESQDSKKASDGFGIVLDDDAGIVPRMLADIVKALCNHYPSFPFKPGQKDGPRLVPRNKSTSYCRLKTLSEIHAKANPNVSVEFYNRRGAARGNTSNRCESPQNSEGDDEGLLSLRVSCVEIVDDLASGECTVNDLLDYYKIADDNVFVSFGESAERLHASLSADEIRHDEDTGIVYIDRAVEMQCQSYAAVMECLTMAEETRQTKSSGIMESCKQDLLFTDKLCHTVYLVSMEHQDARDETTISHQIVISRIDENMSNSASLALHSSYLSLSKVINEIANFSGASIPRTNPLTRLLEECVGGECCTIAIGTVNAEDEDAALPTLRMGEAISWLYNSLDLALNVDPKRFKKASRSPEPPKSPALRQRTNDIQNDFIKTHRGAKNGPTRHSQDAGVSDEAFIRDDFQGISSSREIRRHEESHVAVEEFVPATLGRPKLVQTNTPNKGVRSDYVETPTDNAPKPLTISLRSGDGSYSSFSLNLDDEAELPRPSFLSDALAGSENPFVKKYAEELHKSSRSRLSDEPPFQRSMRSSQSSSMAYDPVKDAKFFLSEMEAMDIYPKERMSVDHKPPQSHDIPINQPRWQDASNEIQNNIEMARKKMMDRIKEQELNKQCALDFTPELPPDESYEPRFPPEFVSVEISSHASSERHQMALDEMQQTHDLAIANMQRALKALQAEKAELLKQKNDNLNELERAREDINRLKIGQMLLSDKYCQGETNEAGEHENETRPAAAESSSEKPNGEKSIRVLVRIRPLSKVEQNCRGYSCIDVPDDSNCCQIKSPYDDEDVSEFNFHKAFGAQCTQEQIYTSTGDACLPKFLSGISCWVLLYGLRSTGKSFTLGTSSHSSCEACEENQGILPRFSRALFHNIHSSDESRSFSLKCSVFGLYLEHFFDLLHPGTKHAPFLSESSTGVEIIGTSEAYCYNESEVMSLVQRGYECRDTLCSKMGVELHYFHTFVVFTLEQYNSGSRERKTSKMWFANIVGSHSAESTFKKTETRIFQRSSLLLRSFVNSLSEGKARPEYRASKLSYLLKDALVGNSFTTTLITASPSSQTIFETSKLVELGQKMQKINKANSGHIHDPTGRKGQRSNVLANTDLKATADDAGMDTDQLKSMYMSAQSEVLVWRQLADSLTQKTCMLERSLIEEKQKKAELEREVEELTQGERKYQDLVDHMRCAHSDDSLDAARMNLNEMQDVLSIFDEGDNLRASRARMEFAHTKEEESDDGSKSIHSEYTKTFHQENPSDEFVGVIRNRSIRSAGPQFGRQSGSRKSKFMESMITSVGALSVDELFDPTPEESPVPITNKIFRNSSQVTADLQPLDINNVDSFYFVRDIEKSYPKMNILRGRQRSKENKSAPYPSLPLQGKVLKSSSVHSCLKQQPYSPE